MTFFVIIGSLMVVLLLAYGGLWLLKGLQPVLGAEGAPEFLSALPIGQRERLVVVRYRERVLLLGVTASAVALLADDADDAIAFPSASSGGKRDVGPAVKMFLNRLSRAGAKPSGPDEGAPL